MLCIELSRLSRDDSLQDYVGWLHLCSQHNVKLATPSRVLDPAQHSDWMLLLMEGGFSSVEMKVLQARMKEGRREAFRAGKYLSGNPPVPYIYSKAEGGLIIDKATLPIAQKALELSESHSVRDVSAQTGLPVIKIRRMLDDSRLLFYQGKRRDPETGQLIDGEWPAIITAQQADKIRASRVQRKSGYRRRNAAGLLSNLNLFYCGYCDRTIRGWKNSRTRNDGKRLDYYGCKVKDIRTECKPSRMITQEIIDEKLTTNLLNTLANSDELQHYWKLDQRSNEPAKKVKTLTKQEAEITQKVSRLVAAISDGIISFADAKNQRRQLDNQLTKIRHELNDLASQMHSEPNWETIALTEPEWDILQFDERREIIAMVIDKVTLYHDYMTITYTFPRNDKGDRTSRVHLPPKAKPGRKPGRKIQDISN